MNMDMDAFSEAVQQQLPGLKTKGQTTAFMAAFEAFRSVVNSILESDPAKELKAREALATGFDTLRKATKLTNMLRDVPEASTSRATEDYRNGPTGWTEYDKQRKLFSELESIQTGSDLNDWYRTNRSRIDEVTTASLRNPLLDAIREKKKALEATEVTR